MTTTKNRLLLLVWKNCLYYIRHPFKTVIQLTVPFILVIIILILRLKYEATKHSQQIYQPYCVSPMQPNCDVKNVTNKFRNKYLMYSPRSNRTDSIMENYKPYFKDIIGFPSETELEAYLIQTVPREALAGIQFDNSFKERKLSKSKLTITIRFPAELSVNPRADWQTYIIYSNQPGPREPISHTGDNPNYFQEGFLFLQQTIVTFTLNISNTNILPRIELRRFPYSEWSDDQIFVLMPHLLPVFVVLIFIYPSVDMIEGMVREKERHLKELMIMKGVKKWQMWVSWFIKNFTFLFVLTVISIAVTKLSTISKPLFQHFDVSVYIIFGLLYLSSNTMFCLLLSTLFSKSSTAVSVSGVLLVLSFAPYFTTLGFLTVSLTSKLTMCLLANTAVCFGFDLICAFEIMREGITWYNLWETYTPDDNLTFGHILVMLVMDIFFYFLLALYIDALFPGPYGIPKPWYLFERAQKVDSSQEANQGPIEREPTRLQVGIQVKHLSKKFSDIKAVRNLSLNMYRGQITVLVGQSGSGKTTTLSMLTGFLPPTDGTAIVNGFDVTKEAEKMRKSLGICPQYTTVFDELTVKEHLYFFASLKGLTKSQVHEENERFIELLDFRENADICVMSLPEIVKRKLCVAISLCGNPKIVMLDEPTLGMDPETRRTLWTFLKNHKQGRTIFLCTRFIEEAEVLGDRMAILVGGQMQCCGSTAYLKKKYGAGYNLNIKKDQNCDVMTITNILKQHIPDVTVNHNGSEDICYLLLKKDTQKFEKVLSILERNMAQFGIADFKISCISLEDVLSKIRMDYEQTMILKATRSKENIWLRKAEIIDRIKLVSGCALIRNQYKAMFIKRIYGGPWDIIFLQIFIPIIYLITSQAADCSHGDLPSLPLSLKEYDKSVILLSRNEDSEFLKIYIKLLQTNKYEFVDNITTAMLELTAGLPKISRFHHILGAEFRNNSITAWYNGDAFHSSALSLALVLNTVYQNFTGTSTYFEFVNYPLPFTLSGEVNHMTNFHIGPAHLIIFSLLVSFTFMIYFYIKERLCKFKRQQLISGLNIFVYWTSGFIFEFIILSTILIAILIVVFTGIRNFEGYTSTAELLRLLVILICFVCGTIPFVFLSTYLYTSAADGINKIFLFALFFGLIVGTLMYYLEITMTSARMIFYSNPFFIGATALLHSEHIDLTTRSCDEFFAACTLHENQSKSYCRRHTCKASFYCCDDAGMNILSLKEPAIGLHILLLVFICVASFLILFFVEGKYLKLLYYKFVARKKYPTEEIQTDNDVQMTNEYIRTTDPAQLKEEYAVVIRDLTKYRKKYPAVDGICLGIKPEESFAIAGTSGSGKSTLVRMLIGDTLVSSGKAWVNEFSIITEERKIQHIIGYCPQTDDLLGSLPVIQTLRIFALIRGIPADDCLTVSKKIASIFDLTDHLQKRVKVLSRCNRRKLSTATAIIGNPKVLILDQPTAGMDPISRRHVWDILSYLRDSDKCIFLASDCMEECELLSTRLAMMVNGKIKCIGSIKHLQSKFAQGYYLVIKVKKDAKEKYVSQIENFIKKNFPSAVLRDKFQRMLTYSILDASMAWSKMFALLEKAKKLFSIEDYSLGEHTMEQVFRIFTKDQKQL